MLFDPGRAPYARPVQRGSAVAPLPIPERPQRHVPFEAPSHGLRPRCLRFAGALTGFAHARLASGWWPAFAGQGFDLPGPYERFPLCRRLSTSLSPFPGLAWRTSAGTYSRRTPRGASRILRNRAELISEAPAPRLLPHSAEGRCLKGLTDSMKGPLEAAYRCLEEVLRRF